MMMVCVNYGMQILIPQLKGQINTFLPIYIVGVLTDWCCESSLIVLEDVGKFIYLGSNVNKNEGTEQYVSARTGKNCL